MLVLRDVRVALGRRALIWTGAGAGVGIVVRASWGPELGRVVWMLRVVRRVVIIVAVAIVLVEDWDGHWAGAGGLWDTATSTRTSAIDATDAAALGQTHSIPFRW